MSVELSARQARRIALAAQGFRDPRPSVPSMRTIGRTVARTGVFQVDSVNVLARAHYLPLFSRVGNYDVDLLHRANQNRSGQPRRLVEYWAHMQALMPVDLWPVMTHRMESYRNQSSKWWGMLPEGLADDLVRRIRVEGASTARQLDDETVRRRDHWGWNWSLTRKALDYAFMVGDLAIAGRSNSFEPCYDLPERVLPSGVLAQPTPEKDEADRELIRRAAASHGVGTAQCLADYFRMPPTAAKAAIAALVESGELVPARIEGWSRPAFLAPSAARPRKINARALLSPFDPLVWERTRTEKLFNFKYRIEIYVPPAKRRYGYYVLPFLLGDRIVARVDLKADRKNSALIVHSSWAEQQAPPDTAAELATELAALASWLGLARIEVSERGDLAPALRASWLG